MRELWWRAVSILEEPGALSFLFTCLSAHGDCPLFSFVNHELEIQEREHLPVLSQLSKTLDVELRSHGLFSLMAELTHQ